MLPVEEIIARLHGLLEELDAIAGEADSEALDELNAEFEDALFMMEDMDLSDEDGPSEWQDALEELDALRNDYAKLPAAHDVAQRMEALIDEAARF